MTDEKVTPTEKKKKAYVANYTVGGTAERTISGMNRPSTAQALTASTAGAYDISILSIHPH